MVSRILETITEPDDSPLTTGRLKRFYGNCRDYSEFLLFDLRGRVCPHGLMRVWDYFRPDHYESLGVRVLERRALSGCGRQLDELARSLR